MICNFSVSFESAIFKKNTRKEQLNGWHVRKFKDKHTAIQISAVGEISLRKQGVIKSVKLNVLYTIPSLKIRTSIFFVIKC